MFINFFICLKGEGQWRKVGDVVGQPKNKDPSGRGLQGGKVMYEGVEYGKIKIFFLF